MENTSATGRARERLREAMAARSDAEHALEEAERAASSAAKFAAKIENELTQYTSADRDLANTRAAGIRYAISIGAPPTIAASGDISKAIARVDAENQLAAAAQAAQELAAEAATARTKAQAASNAFNDAVTEVAVAEADAIAEEIERLDAQAMALRVRLGGGTSCNVARLAGLGDTCKRVIRSSDGSDMSIRNTAGWHLAQAADAEWLTFMKAIAEDASAELSVRSA